MWEVLDQQQAKDINGRSISRMSEADAAALLQTARWGNLTEQECPACHRRSAHWYRRTRRQWKCRYEDCGHNFSLTSGTALANTKLDPTMLVHAAYEFIQSPDAAPAREVARDLGVASKTSFVLMHRFRDAIVRTRDPHACDGLVEPEAMTPDTERALRLSGDVEIDGAYFCHHVRPANPYDRRVDRRRARNMNPHKRCVLVMRQRGVMGMGAAATRLAVIDSEMGFPMDRLIPKYVRPGATLFTDEQIAYRRLGKRNRYTVKQVDHKQCYRSREGHHENQAESFFARMRKQQRRLSGCAAKYLLAYAHETAWREDFRGASLREKLLDLLRRCMGVKPSPDWTGYHQGRQQTLDPIWRHTTRGRMTWGRDAWGHARPARLWAGLSVKGREPRNGVRGRAAPQAQQELPLA